MLEINVIRRREESWLYRIADKTIATPMNPVMNLCVKLLTAGSVQ